MKTYRRSHKPFRSGLRSKFVYVNTIKIAMDCTQQMGQTPLTPKLALQRKDPKKRKLARLKSLPTCLESQPATADAKADEAFSLMVKTAVLPPTPQERLALLRSQDSFGGRSTLTQAETRPLGVDVSVKDWVRQG